MIVRLGYVALSLTLEDTSYSRSMTYTTYKKKTLLENEKILYEKVKNNLEGLLEILKYNYNNNIYFFRLSHKMIPLATLDDVKFDYMTPFIELGKKVGTLVKNINFDLIPIQINFVY